MVYEINLKHFIKSQSIFSGLEDDDTERLLNIAQQLSFPKGKVIFSEDNKAEGFFLTVDGQVKIYKLSQDGNEQIIRICRKGEMFAEAGMFGGQKYPAYSMCLTAVELLFFPVKEFLNVLMGSPKICIKMLMGQAQLLRKLNTLVEELSLKEASARLAHFLIEETKDGLLKRFDLDIAKNVLARQIGVSSETLSRTLAKLAGRQLIIIEGKTITIENLEQLKKIAEGEKI